MKVVLKQGELIGIEEKSIPSGKQFYSYLGIPYAEPPVNLLRFQDPKPHKGWKGVLEACKPGSACLQKTIYISPSPFGDEDCLYVNVHVPQSTSRKLRPVMVYVHGGGFLTGTGDFYGPEYLIEYDIIVVTFNYRLHVFGFLNLNLPECPGNMGLKDQVLLFKWVRDNISSFGGDPNNVTAVGESAGGASIHYIMMSPWGKGLFDRAIIQSGSALCPWAFTTKQKEHAFQLGEILGCKTTNRRELLNFLLEVPAIRLSKAARILTAQVRQMNITELAFVPSIECGTYTNLKLSFLPATPQTLVRNACYVPLLTGINDLESLIFITDISDNALFSLCKDENILLEALKSTNAAPTVLKEVETFYQIGKKSDEQSLAAIIDLWTDVHFAYPFDRTCANILLNSSRKHINTCSVYNYKFSYEGSLNLHKRLVTGLFNYIDLKGASHSDELSYLFALRTIYRTAPGSEELKMIQIMCALWSNFITFGKPSRPDDRIEWIPTTLDQPCYLHISDEMRMERGRINEARMIFWDNLLQRPQTKKYSQSRL